MFGRDNLLHIIALFLFVTLGLADDKESESHKDVLPEPLTPGAFNEAMKADFHLIEFYSPYCPHCKHFAPTWEKFYNQDHKAYGSSKHIHIHQVNCVSNGDLCSKEGIQFFPTIRFYAAGGKLLATMGVEYDRDVQGLEAFCDDQISVWGNDDVTKSEDTTGSNDVFPESHLLTKEELTKLLLGEGQENPVLVSFWPSTDETLPENKFQSDFKDLEFYKEFAGCYSFRNVWNDLGRRLSSKITKNELSMAYFNCGSHAKICNSLGIKGWNSRYPDETIPHVMMMLPSTKGGNRIVYRGRSRLTMKDLISWTNRLLRIYKFDPVNTVDVKTEMGVVSYLRGEGDMPGYSRVSFVLVEDRHTKVPEDEEILDKLIQPIMDMRDDVYLFKSTDRDGFQRLLRAQARFLENDYFNQDLPENTPKDSPKRSTYDNGLFAARTLSSLPMIVCLRSNALDGVVMKSFSSADVRNKEKVMKFISKNAYPMARPLTTTTADVIFPEYDSEKYSEDEVVLVSLLDFKKPKEMQKVQHSMSYVYHKYTYLRWKEQYDTLDSERKAKYQKVKDVQDTATHHDIMEIMSEPVKETFENMRNNLRVAYMDIEKFDYFRRKLGWKNVRPDLYQSGDFLLFSRFGSSFWDKDAYDKQLNYVDTNDTIQVIMSTTTSELSGSSTNSEWWKVPLYIIVGLCAVIIALRYGRRMIHRWKMRQNRVKGLGILGDPDMESTELNKLE